MANSKPKVIKSYGKLEKAIQQQIKLIYTDGFADNLIHFFDKNGIKITVLPFETADKYYMIRMTEGEAVALIEDDDDFGDDGFLREDVKDKYEGRYAELEHISEQITEEI